MLNNSSTLPPSITLIAALRRIECGIIRIGVVRGHPAHSGCSTCYFELKDGTLVQFYTDEQSLNFRFEVFPLDAQVVPTATGVEWNEFELLPPVNTALMETEEWQDPTINCDGAVGQNPVLQCQGLPYSAPAQATKSADTSAAY